MSNLTTEKYPAAAGGNPAVQLRHLRAHRKFQRQEKYKKTRIDWKTVIDQAESRRHVARHLHAKINLKAGGLQPAGRMNTEDGQRSRASLARRVGNRERISPGDGLGLNWNLRRRMVQTGYPSHSNQAFGKIIRLDHPGAVPPKDEGFPTEVRERKSEQERLKHLLIIQGASPRRRRQAGVIEIYACPGCHDLFYQELITEGRCRVCIYQLGEADLVKIAVKAGPEQKPMGSVDRHRR